MDSLYSHEYDQALGKFQYTANTYYRKREEGWATTFVGMHNTFAIKDIDKNQLPKIAIWGDSEVEAFQVPDTSKMAQQVSDMFARTGHRLLGLGIAHSDNSLADYVVDLRRYESLIPKIVSHYIVICDLNDTLPTANANRSTFEYNHGFKLVDSECRPPHQRVLNQLRKYNLRIISYLYGKVSKYRVQLPWSRREAVNVHKVAEEPAYEKLEAWKFVLGELRKQSTMPITFLYCPYVPTIRNGGICLKDSSERDKMILAGICRRHDIVFIDLTERFLDFYSKNKVFPRGFANTMPGRGHLNGYGHRLVAEAIFSNELRRNLADR
jgi:hypothetical protein